VHVCVAATLHVLSLSCPLAQTHQEMEAILQKMLQMEEEDKIMEVKFLTLRCVCV